MVNSGEYFSGKESVKNILLNSGYPVSESSNYINTAAYWRGGRDPKSVAIYYEDNMCVDFVEGSKFDIKKLISLVLNKKSDEEVNEYFKKNKIILPPPSPKIIQVRTFEPEIINFIHPIYDYWNKRGISDGILKEVGGGIYRNKSTLNGRYVFPIYNSQNIIVGLACRDVNGNDGSFKWMLRGNKSNWCFNAKLNTKDIKNKNSVFLLESIGDYLAFMESGIRNCLVLFGTELNLAIINYLLKLNIGKIYVSTNDDSLNNHAGNKAANKAYNRLIKYFSVAQVKIILPKKEKDWNEVLIKYGKQEILEQLKNYV